MESTKHKRLFYIEYAHACIKLPPSELRERWRGPDCDLKVILKDGKFEAEGSFDKPKKPLTLWEAAHLDSTTPPETIKCLVNYSGDVLGFGIRYKLHVTEEGDRGLGLGLPSAIDKEGIMIISEDLNKIKVCEKDKGEESKFYSLEQIETGD